MKLCIKCFNYIDNYYYRLNNGICGECRKRKEQKTIEWEERKIKV